MALLWAGGIIVFFGRGCLILITQVMGWLKSGVWHGHTALETIRWVDTWIGEPGLLTQWSNTPDSWLGLWKLLNWLPDSVFCGLVAGALYAIAGSLEALDMNAPKKRAGAGEDARVVDEEKL